MTYRGPTTTTSVIRVKTEDPASYFDEDGKQLKPLPAKWLDLSRFKVGDRIRYLRRNLVHIPCAECKAKSWFHYNNANAEKCESRDMAGSIGVVLKVNQGDSRCWPPRWVPDASYDEGGNWLGQHAGWLTVQFPFCNHYTSAGEYAPLAMQIEEEGADWELV